MRYLTDIDTYATIILSSTNKRSNTMQLQMSQREKFVYGFIAVAIVFMVIEHKYEPVGITTDVAEFAANRISGSSAQATASTVPKTAKVARASVGKVQTSGSTVVAPLPQMYGQHTVAKGETLWSIARANNVPPKELLAANGMTRDTKLYPGQMVTIPK